MANIGHFNGTNSVLSNVSQIGFRAINFRQKTQTIVTQTLSGRTIRSSVATTLWSASLEFPALTYQEFRQVQGFVALAKGSLNDFYIQFPNISSRTAGGTIEQMQVLDDATAGSTSVKAYTPLDSAGNILDFTPTPFIRAPEGTVLNMGDMIKFSNHDKVYMVTTDVTPDSGGDFIINFEPALVTAVPGIVHGDSAGETAQVIFDNVPFKMIFLGDTADYRYNVDGTVNFRIDVQEVV